MPSHHEEQIFGAASGLHEPVLRVDERPGTALETLLYGWQHTLVDISPFVLPLAVAGALGLSSSAQAQFINFCLFSMGIATLIQTTIGNRLPIIQGPSATLTGTLTPIAAQLGAPVMWGGIMLGSLFEMAVGASRAFRALRWAFPAVVSGVIIVSIGLALGQVAIRLALGAGHLRDLTYAVAAVLLIFILQVKFRGILGGIISRGAIFFTIAVLGLGVAAPLGHVDWALVAAKPWFALPQLFPYGGPGFGWQLGVAASLGILVGFVGSMIESIGDYAATCLVCREDFEIRHINRGLFAEGLGSAVAALFGGLPCTSYTQNIGIIATTRVASRFVVQIAAVILIAYGVCPKFGALLVAIPRAILGGVFVIVCGMIATSGMTLIGRAEKTGRNALIAGTSLIVATAVPIYSQTGLGQAWLDAIPTLLSLLVGNTVVIAVVCAVLLNAFLNVWLPRIPPRDSDDF